ncbi:MAG TPA: helix-turn-helix transcriptional regulator [Alphaproteobacteria bacterium]|nr:helix-turn-helix transcriptional regulator [Alphaproteobacteria bacterium]
MTALLKQDNSEISLLLKTLKNILKSRGLLYQDVAAALGVSETTVKRYLTGHSLSVDVLEQLCRLVDLRMSDLVDIARESQAELPPLSHAQEENLAREPFMASLFYLIAKGHTPQSLQKDFGIDDAQMNRFLTTLDRWGLIRLFPFNRVKLRVSPLFQVERGGPLARSLRANMLDDMFRKFDVEMEDWSYSFAKLSPASVERARELLREFTHALAKISEQDRDLTDESAGYWSMFVMMTPLDVRQQKVKLAACGAKAA